MVLADVASDVRELDLSFAVLLYDGFTGEQRLRGQVVVSLAADKPRNLRFLSFQKKPEATFLFFGLSPGTYNLQVRSNNGWSDRMFPYYLPADISITVADPPNLIAGQSPIWPVFPNPSLADRGKPLDDPTQPAPFAVQRRAATLQPAVGYPFPAGATLVRGHVFANRKPVAEAKVQRVDDDLQYPTDDNGEFVLWFKSLLGLGETITLQATHTLHPTLKQVVEVQRGSTVSTTFVMDS
jgi:hypothetical protein